MCRLLIVDDEEYAVRALLAGVEWNEMGIDEVEGVFCAAHAIEKLKNSPFDIVICDIEMPGMNGIELLNWIKEYYPSTEVIILTAHADFSFAQRAIQLNSFDYLLKPIDLDVLKEIVEKSLEKIQEEKEKVHYYEMYKKSHDIWEKQLPILVERFWQDVLSGRILLGTERMNNISRMYRLPLHAASSMALVLIGVDEWGEDMDTKDEEIMEYGLRNIAEEVILKGLRGNVIQDHDGNNIVLLYLNDNGMQRDEQRLIRNCNEYIKVCKKCIQVSLCCYMSKIVPLSRIVNAYDEMFELQRSNVANHEALICADSLKSERNEAFQEPVFLDISKLFEFGSIHELQQRTDDYLETIKQSPITVENMEFMYHGIVYSIYYMLHNKRIPVKEVYGIAGIGEESFNFRSVAQFKAWYTKIIAACLDYLEQHTEDEDSVISKVKKIVNEQYGERITREDIATRVYLNSAYLSRLFKKSTGMGLCDYITQVRIEHAKRLLRESDEKIAAIAEIVGYNHVSHFAGTFKKIVGMNPQDYRRLQG